MDFILADNAPGPGGSQLVPIGPAPFAIHEAVHAIAGEVATAYSKSFPGRPAMRFAVQVYPRNGASGFWTMCPSPSEGPFFAIALDPSITQDQAVLDYTMVHELAHPLPRLQGMEIAFANPPNPKKVADEYASTSQHPYVFSKVEAAGFGETQRTEYAKIALRELEKLAGDDMTNDNYTAPPGQIWRALWYFNFSIVAPEQYQAIKAFCQDRAPGVFARMQAVEAAWKDARNRASAKEPVSRCKAFSNALWRELALEGFFRRQSMQEWGRWMFPWA